MEKKHRIQITESEIDYLLAIIPKTPSQVKNWEDFKTLATLRKKVVNAKQNAK